MESELTEVIDLGEEVKEIKELNSADSSISKDANGCSTSNDKIENDNKDKKKEEEDTEGRNELEDKSVEGEDVEQVGVVEIEEVIGENISDQSDHVPKETSEKGLSNDIEDLHQQKEAELENYLESLKPKPKRKSIKEMLMSMPGFDKLATVTPKLGGDEKQNVIFLDDEVDKKVKEKMSKQRQQIEDLKDRFVRHVITAPAKPVNEHIKLKITKKEEDSQGIEHLIENEVEYVSSPMNENEEASDILSTLSNTSPQSFAPMAQRRRLQDMLLKKIRAQKLKEHEEQCKALAMYDDEVDADEKDEFENEEVVDSESENESGIDEEEEEELEDLLSSSTKKKRKKSAFVDEEAEDEDASEADDDTDDDDDDDDHDNDSDESDDEVQNVDSIEHKSDENDDVSSMAISDDSLPAAQIPTNNMALDDEIASKSFETTESEGSNFIIDVNTTPKLTNVVLNQRPPSDFWVASKTSSGFRNDELSPLIPRINTFKETVKKCTVNIDALPATLSNVISKPETKFDDLVDLCSGKFVSQANGEISETQENDEFDGFDFGDDEDVTETNENDGFSKTPATLKTRKTAVDGITPKLSEKAPKTRLLMQFDDEAENENNEKSNLNEVDAVVNPTTNEPTDDDGEEEIGYMRIKNKKRLQFSDDEDDGDADVTPVSPSQHSQSEVEDEEDGMSVVEAEPKPKAGLFFTKGGRLKRKFVEDEAELSGSDEGSDDEDERGLNHYEMEDGEDEEFDEVALENQVKRAHMKQLLDDDDRQILKLQNTYLENGDLHTDKQRERKFRWFNVNAIDDDAVMCNSDEEEKEETPEETSQKQAWLEKRKWISENSHLLEPEDDHSQSLLSNNRYLRLGKNTLKKIESFVDASTSDSNSMQIKVVSNQRKSIYDEIIRAKNAAKRAVDSNSNSFSEGMNFSSVLPHEVKKSTMATTTMSEPLIVIGDSSPTLTQPLPSTKKGSFLSRGGMMLAKIAEVNKTGDITSNVKTNSRNFVFSHVTPPNQDKINGTTSRVKRGSTGGMTSCKMQAKKLKIDRSFSNMDEASKGASIFKWL